MKPTTKMCLLAAATLLATAGCNTDGSDGTEPVDSGIEGTGVDTTGADGATGPNSVGTDPLDTEDSPAGSVDGTSDATLADGSLAVAAGSVCVVVDNNGPGPQGRSVAEGARLAAAELAITAEIVESNGAEEDAAAAFDQFVDDGCSLVIASGVGLANAAEAAANRHVDQQFAIVDYDYPRRIDNMMELVFTTTEPAFLAGYLAAGTTTTGVVATYAGINIEPFTLTLDGFANGVDFYNRETGTTVAVLGWDGTDGRFVGSLDDADAGRAVAAEFAEQGADVIFPVAGDVGLGTAAFAVESADPILVIGADHDVFEIDPDLGSVYLTSVVKNFDVAVVSAVERSLVLGELGGQYVGTLENDGVDIAPFHDQSSLVTDDLREQLDELRIELIAGNVTPG